MQDGSKGGAPLEAHLVLLAHMELRDWLRFLKTHVPGSGQTPAAEWMEVWRRARAMRSGLSREAGLADGLAAEAVELPEGLRAQAAALLEEPVLRRTLQHTPARWGMVELDRLLVFQRRLNLTRVREIQAGLGRTPSVEALYGLASGQTQAPVQIQEAHLGEGVHAFWTARGELRVLEMGLLEASLLQPTAGTVLSVAGVAIGAPVNVVMALEMGGRLLLCNGNHRAYAARALGVTHMPCVIRAPAGEEELELVAPADVLKQRELYLRGRRPPLLKDYFDPGLFQVLQTPPYRQWLHVHISVRETHTPVG